ncbi:right-handed parallel beta-helix repeat-containing protein [uncultured Parolsenella sp.]|uniref:right-handed parallel beta-helix repeat-containing protein n=1 Tax=uncultured Parolsenella sp. TaxID=2083008 RepID=UPI0027D93E6D|nr:right-handed parallel beta-helix repeat-containing protein [uncultured Parolsenella sp.]
MAFVLFAVSMAVSVPAVAEEGGSSRQATPSAATLSTVYLGGANASDDNDGASAATGVATFARARELLAQDGTIELASTYTVNDEQTLSLEGKGSATVKRASGMAGPMIELGSSANLTLEHVVFDGAEPSGGKTESLIKETAEGASLTLGDGAVLRNSTVASGTMGSAIQAYGLALTMKDGAEVTGNSTTSAGYGAIFLTNGSTFDMRGGTISNNTSNRGGGVALVGGVQMTMSGGTIKGNKTYGVLDGGVDSYGGAVYLSNYEEISTVHPFTQQLRAGDAKFTMTGGTISGNKSDTYGGAILTFPDTRTSTGGITVDIQGGAVSGNTSTSGGAIAAFRLDSIKTRVNVSGGTISGNTATNMGGGLFLYGMTDGDGSALAKVSGGEISGNEAQAGGGAFLYRGSTLEQSGGKTTGNTAQVTGGGVYIDKNSSRFAMSGGEVSGNNANVVDQSRTKGDGVYVGGRFQASGSAHVAKDNDVYLPTGHYVEVVDTFSGQTWDAPMSITSEDHVVEPVNVSVAGTKLVEYTDAAGGEEAAKKADDDAIYVPSDKMLAIDPTFTIGKSEASGQTNFMTYVAMQKAPWKYEVYYEKLNDAAAASEDATNVADASGRTFVLGATVEQRQRYLGTEVSISHDQFDGMKMGVGTLGTEYVYDDGAANVLSGKVQPANNELVLRIYYRLAEHSVTYEYEGETPDGAPAVPAVASEKVSAMVDVAEAPTLDGWEFSGWSVESPSGLAVSDGTFSMPNEDVKLVGSWRRVEAPPTPNEPTTPDDPASPDEPTSPNDPVSPENPDDQSGYGDKSLPQTGDPATAVTAVSSVGGALLGVGFLLRGRRR